MNNEGKDLNSSTGNEVEAVSLSSEKVKAIAGPMRAEFIKYLDGESHSISAKTDDIAVALSNVSWYKKLYEHTNYPEDRLLELGRDIERAYDRLLPKQESRLGKFARTIIFDLRKIVGDLKTKVGTGSEKPTTTSEKNHSSHALDPYEADAVANQMLNFAKGDGEIPNFGAIKYAVLSLATSRFLNRLLPTVTPNDVPKILELTDVMLLHRITEDQKPENQSGPKLGKKSFYELLDELIEGGFVRTSIPQGSKASYCELVAIYLEFRQGKIDTLTIPDSEQQAFLQFCEYYLINLSSKGTRGEAIFGAYEPIINHLKGILEHGGDDVRNKFRSVYDKLEAEHKASPFNFNTFKGKKYNEDNSNSNSSNIYIEQAKGCMKKHLDVSLDLTGATPEQVTELIHWFTLHGITADGFPRVALSGIYASIEGSLGGVDPEVAESFKRLGKVVELVISNQSGQLGTSTISSNIWK